MNRSVTPPALWEIRQDSLFARLALAQSNQICGSAFSQVTRTRPTGAGDVFATPSGLSLRRRPRFRCFEEIWAAQITPTLDVRFSAHTTPTLGARKVHRPAKVPPFMGLAPCFLRGSNCSRRASKNESTNTLRPNATPAVK